MAVGCKVEKEMMVANPESNIGNSCRNICWAVAIISGLVVAAVLNNLTGWGWVISLVAGIGGALAAGMQLGKRFCDSENKD